MARFHGQLAGGALAAGLAPGEPRHAAPTCLTDMRIGAGWALTLIQNDDGFYAWRNAAGEPRLHPHSCRLAGHRSRELQGDLDLAARGQDGLWLPTELKANLQLRPSSTLLTNLPAALRPSQLNITPLR